MLRFFLNILMFLLNIADMAARLYFALLLWYRLLTLLPVF